MPSVLSVQLNNTEFILFGDSMLRRFYNYVHNTRDTPQSSFCRGGQEIGDLTTALKKNTKYFVEQKLLIMIGTNDLMRISQPRRDFAFICQDLLRLRNLIQKCKFSKIIWLSIPPVPCTFFNPGHRDAWIEVNSFIQDQIVPSMRNTQFLSITDLFCTNFDTEIQLSRYVPEHYEPHNMQVHWNSRTIDIVRERIRQLLFKNTASRYQRFR